MVVDIVLLLRIDGCFALGVCFGFCGACVFVYLVVWGVGIWIVFVSLVVACVCGGWLFVPLTLLLCGDCLFCLFCDWFPVACSIVLVGGVLLLIVLVCTFCVYYVFCSFVVGDCFCVSFDCGGCGVYVGGVTMFALLLR